MEYLLHILVIAGIYIILALSLNLIVGYTGLPALGHAAFSCIGAYTSSLLALNMGLSPWIGLLIGACVAALSGIVIGYPAVRLKGDYLALATFGLGVIVYSIAKNWVSLTRGPMGLPGIPGFSIAGFQLSEIWSYLLLILVFVVITIFIINRIVNSPFGRILRSIREDEIASQALGKNTIKYKLLVFIIGAFFAGIAGSLYAHYITFIDPSSFTVMESITILLMVIFGGMGNISGSMVGAVILVVFPELLRFLGMPSSIAAPMRQMIYGLLLVVLMLRRPQGIMGAYRFK
ncbi:MAG: branched-chain amino acid ABC transporter permease [Acidobacteria bacterium]|nr:branched-chain amino acid ABC transporter permease [Acidobacteriota bacterium]MBU4307339.1 branched-chain amino acid ABC transporter permease [Acidobacteriota bacterium]MCG2810496.1 branched-chain amino acid ABC transporter permease [Candidatus Aminicenantes bacterium]MCG2821716.1 branched-chain amino acid ABC transporter permease [Candidatus Atribacteria bacterium]